MARTTIVSSALALLLLIGLAPAPDAVAAPPSFELVKGKAKKIGSTALWNLKFQKCVYEPGFTEFGGDLGSLLVRLNGLDYFSDLSAATVKAKRNTAGLITKVTIKDTLKDKIVIDLRKGKLKLTVKSTPVFHPGILQVEIRFGGTIGTMDVPVTIRGARSNKATLEPTVGVMST